MKYAADTIRASNLARRVGVGARMPHARDLVAAPAAVGFLELLADNHLEPGTPAHECAISLAERYPVTVHCVGMSLGSPDAFDRSYFSKLRNLCDRVGALVVSDHIAFTRFHGVEYHDLLPLPFTEQALRHLCLRVDEAQDLLGGRLAVENGSRYLGQPPDAMPESEFLQALCERTGCRLILDINNAYVNEFNLGESALALMEALPQACIAYVHVAGHQKDGDRLLDTHGDMVAPEVLGLLRRFGSSAPQVPVCLEWDRNLPTFPQLMDEVRRIECLLEEADDVVVA
jgi:uncharacterized protein (UPF0276 family)